MARDEHQTEKVVADVVVESGFEVWHRPLLLRLELERNLFVFAIEERASAQVVYGAMLGSRHEPGAGIIRDTRSGPLLESRNQRILRQILGESDVVHHPREPGDQLG
jgi:hypothetical protein